ncbi:catechol 1,2-dioxygenase [Anopheles sinensis]|uniref:Catechol 1,2-dioxygenase n=1 Tax=Anopheles sinensis TaxID=74873 RepID=A0A084VWC8_ANOSI|nr:catechol 1,2-dioxygenase [Anopheles sinensis]
MSAAVSFITHVYDPHTIALTGGERLFKSLAVKAKTVPKRKSLLRLLSVVGKHANDLERFATYE